MGKEHYYDEFDPFDYAEQEEDEFDLTDDCGRWRNGTLTRYCALAGTEYCDWDCPLHGARSTS